VGYQQVAGVSECWVCGDAAGAVTASALQAERQFGEWNGDAADVVGGGQHFPQD